MLGLMQDHPLLIRTALRRASKYASKRRIAVVTGKTTETTWGEVTSRAIKLSNALRRRGIGLESVVGSFAWNTHRHLELYFGVPCLGAVLHTINVRLHPEQILDQLRLAQDVIIFVDASLTEILAPVKEKCAGSIQFVVMPDGGEISSAFSEDPSYEDFIADESDEIDFPDLDENTAALLCFTSGTTGKAKGVLYSHRSEILHAQSGMFVDGFAVSERDTILLAAPLFHANGWGMPYSAALAGSSLIFTGRYNDPETLVRAIRNERVTFAAGVPTVWIGVDRHLTGDTEGLGALRRILIGGAASSEALIESFDSRGVAILQAWGMTETSPSASIARVTSAHVDASAADQVALRATQGIAGPGMEVRVCAENGEELPWDGQSAGELEARGPWVAKAYFTDEAGSERFHDGWLRTGDVATIDSYGYIRIFDRLKDVIKSGGEWVSSVEVEGCLASHPAVGEAAVVGIPDSKWGERPVALVVLKESATVTIEELKEHLSAQMPRWWIPDSFRFCAELPKTSVGKYDKKKIRADWEPIMREARND